jgi:hypothetical protein
MLNEEDVQRQTLRIYGELVAKRDGWGGHFVFADREGSSATGLPAAVSIAGGCTLVVDPDMATVKRVFRQGGVDFVVHTLDEAVRVLKNEIRKQRPLGVALIADPETTIAEMSERGIQPDLHWSRDALALSQLDAWLSDRGWMEVSLPARARRTLEAETLALLPPSDHIRRRWIERVAHYQRPTQETSRLCWLTANEAAILNSASR